MNSSSIPPKPPDVSEENWRDPAYRALYCFEGDEVATSSAPPPESRATSAFVRVAAPHQRTPPTKRPLIGEERRRVLYAQLAKRATADWREQARIDAEKEAARKKELSAKWAADMRAKMTAAQRARNAAEEAQINAKWRAQFEH